MTFLRFAVSVFELNDESDAKNASNQNVSNKIRIKVVSRQTCHLDEQLWVGELTKVSQHSIHPLKYVHPSG